MKPGLTSSILIAAGVSVRSWLSFHTDLQISSTKSPLMPISLCFINLLQDPSV